MKTITILMISCFLFSFCSKNKESKTEEIQEARNQETYIQEVQTVSVSYVFDIDSFKYLDEFPSTITDIKAMYPNEAFIEEMSEYTGRYREGKYWYALTSPSIQFHFWGDSFEEAKLYDVEIFKTEYQCQTIQIIGMLAEELEIMSGEKLTRDKTIVIYNETHDGLTITTKDGIVQSYLILGAL